MIPLETLKNPSAGFLVNDTIAVGVELIKCKKVHCKGQLRRSSIQKNKTSGSFSWCVEDFLQLNNPVAFSKPFQIAGYTWKLALKPEGEYNNNFLSLYLEIDNSALQLLPSSGLMVDAVLSVKKSESGAYARRYHPLQFHWEKNKLWIHGVYETGEVQRANEWIPHQRKMYL
ncbi:TRAF-like superfamily protein [Rhynchospora pubera]|uniref:TRAF-like superfamily protein n=1 Tax=Rhynchospora pubera TaxID=906938 RepID=A0AAV8E329_9POAL|nr:TRAF-like superfamily protein [Rhynchospora pubera]